MHHLNSSLLLTEKHKKGLDAAPLRFAYSPARILLNSDG
jgi:hypothetical protein